MAQVAATHSLELLKMLVDELEKTVVVLQINYYTLLREDLIDHLRLSDSEKSMEGIADDLAGAGFVVVDMVAVSVAVVADYIAV